MWLVHCCLPLSHRSSMQGAGRSCQETRLEAICSYTVCITAGRQYHGLNSGKPGRSLRSHHKLGICTQTQQQLTLLADPVAVTGLAATYWHPAGLLMVLPDP